jgi:glycosyltransferase involved in cell wall biosynthesis
VKINPLVSIVIPCYNKSKYLPDSIESALNQSYTHIECIIVDDGSTDNSGEIANKYRESDDRMKYFYKENGGVSTTRNYGIKKAEGEWVQFLDADDWLHKEKIQRQLEYYEEIGNGKDVVLFSDYEINEQDDTGRIVERNEITFDDINNEQLVKMIISRPFGLGTPTPLHVNNTLFRKEVFQKIMFNESVYYEDIIFFYELLIDEHIKFVHTPFIGMYYRSNRDGISKVSEYSRVGYLQFLETVYATRKSYLQYSPNMNVLIKYFIQKQYVDFYNRAIYLVRNSDIPVFSTKQTNIKTTILALDKLKLLYPLIRYRKKLRINYPQL